MTVSLSGGAVGVKFHGFEVAVERHADVTVLAVGVAAQVVGIGECLAVYTLALDDFAHGIEGFLSLAAGQHLLDFLYGFHLVSCFIGQNYKFFANYHYLCH